MLTGHFLIWDSGKFLSFFIFNMSYRFHSRYGYTSRPDKRSLRRGRHVLARNGTGAGDDDAVHCDDTCHRRNSQIEAYEATLLPGPPADS